MSNLEHYGLDLLQDDAIMQYLIDQKPESVSEITDILFEQARANGTLTFSTVDAAKELFDAHPLNEIIEEFQEFPVDANTLNEENVHVYFAEKDFAEMLCNEYEDREYPQDITDSEKMLAIIFNVSVENDLGLEKDFAEIALAGLHAHTPEDFMDLTGFTSLENFPDDFKNHKEFMLQVLGETNDRALDLYLLLPENLQHDDEIIRTAIHYSRKNTSESFLDVAPEDLKRNLDYIEETLSSSYSAASNKETLMNVFSIKDERAGEMLKYASEALRDDPEVVAAAVLRNPQAIKFSSERIQENPDLLKSYQKEAAHDRPAVQLNKPTGKGLER
ncbi:MAG: DUF4116 domain-containing protein [Negativicoccus succinicivorans]|nr:DUF4116 domain-containing protein [Negativicoccus succinicivorans]